MSYNLNNVDDLYLLKLIKTSIVPNIIIMSHFLFFYPNIPTIELRIPPPPPLESLLEDEVDDPPSPNIPFVTQLDGTGFITIQL
jgi:hypothetical protein